MNEYLLCLGSAKSWESRNETDMVPASERHYIPGGQTDTGQSLQRDAAGSTVEGCIGSCVCIHIRTHGCTWQEGPPAQPGGVQGHLPGGNETWLGLVESVNTEKRSRQQESRKIMLYMPHNEQRKIWSLVKGPTVNS